MRHYRLFFECNNPKCSPLGSEWVDEALVVCTGYCSCCDEPAEPYAVEEIEEETAQEPAEEAVP